MTKIYQMEADRRKSDERIHQLEGILQSHGHPNTTVNTRLPNTINLWLLTKDWRPNTKLFL